MAQQYLDNAVRLCFRFPWDVTQQLFGNIGLENLGMANLGADVHQIIPMDATAFLIFIGWDSFVPCVHPERQMGNFVRGCPYRTNVTIFLIDGDIQDYEHMREEAPQLGEGVLVSFLPPPLADSD